MSDSESRSIPPAPDDVIARIDEGERDTQLSGGGLRPARHRRLPPIVLPEPLDAGAAADHERPSMPRGGLVALRRSGGLRFTTSEAVVLRDGRVRSGPEATVGRRPGQRVRRLSENELAVVTAALDQSGIAGLAPQVGRQNPDGYAYEITARIGRRLYAVTVFEGSIPESIEPLVRLLSGYASERDH